MKRSGLGMSVDKLNQDLGGDTTIQTPVRTSIESSTTVVEKVTPLRVNNDGQHDLTWYVKWFATVIMIFAVAFRAVEEAPKIIDQFLTLVGMTGWLFVAYKWHDRALMLVNGIAIPIILVGVIRWVYTYLN